MTGIYFTCFEERQPDHLFERRLNTLPSFLIEKTKRFRRWQDAHASLFGKLLLLEGLKAFNVVDALNSIQYTRFGKPYLRDCPVCFNISHSGHFVICVVSNEVDRVGVDVELVKPINIYDLKNVWTDKEWNEIEEGGVHLFYEYWTRKEAVLKADGRGLGIPFKDIDVRDTRVSFNSETYFLKAFDLSVNYKIHLAALKEVIKVDEVWLKSSDLLQ